MLGTILCFLIPILFQGHAKLAKLEGLETGRFCSGCEFIIDEIDKRLDETQESSVQVGFRMGKTRKRSYIRSESHVMDVLDDQIELILAKYSIPDENDSEDIQRTKRALVQVYRRIADNNEAEMVRMFSQRMHAMDIKKRLCVELSDACNQKTEMVIVLNVVGGKAGLEVDVSDVGFTVTALSSTNPDLKVGDVIVAINEKSLVKKSLKKQTKIWKKNLMHESLLKVNRPNGLGYNVNTLRSLMERFDQERKENDAKGIPPPKVDPRKRVLEEIESRESQLLDILEANSKGLRAQMNVLIDKDDYERAGNLEKQADDNDVSIFNLKNQLQNTQDELDNLNEQIDFFHNEL